MNLDYIEESSDDGVLYVAHPSNRHISNQVVNVHQAQSNVESYPQPYQQTPQSYQQLPQPQQQIPQSHQQIPQPQPQVPYPHQQFSIQQNNAIQREANISSSQDDTQSIQSSQSQLEIEVLEQKLNTLELLIQEKGLIVQQIEQLKKQLELVDKRIAILEVDVMQSANIQGIHKTNEGEKKHEPIRVNETKTSQSNASNQSQTTKETGANKGPLSSHAEKIQSPARNIPKVSRSPARNVMKTQNLQSPQTRSIQSPQRLRSASPSNTSNRSRTPTNQGRSLTPTRSTPNLMNRTPVISRMPTKEAPGSASRNIFDRLTDPAYYTGTHRERFDIFGRGRGLAGRREYFKNGIPYDEVFPRDSPGVNPTKSREVMDEPAARVMIQTILKADPEVYRSPPSLSRSNSRESVFDHLTNPATYTGMYKVRAEEGELLHKQIYSQTQTQSPFIPPGK